MASKPSSGALSSSALTDANSRPWMSTIRPVYAKKMRHDTTRGSRVMSAGTVTRARRLGSDSDDDDDDDAVPCCCWWAWHCRNPTTDRRYADTESSTTVWMPNLWNGVPPSSSTSAARPNPRSPGKSSSAEKSLRAAQRRRSAFLGAAEAAAAWLSPEAPNSSDEGIREEEEEEKRPTFQGTTW